MSSKAGISYEFVKSKKGDDDVHMTQEELKEIQREAVEGFIKYVEDGWDKSTVMIQRLDIEFKDFLKAKQLEKEMEKAFMKAAEETSKAKKKFVEDNS